MRFSTLVNERRAACNALVLIFGIALAASLMLFAPENAFGASFGNYDLSSESEATKEIASTDELIYIGDADIPKIPNQTYIGGFIKPDISVVKKGKTLVKDIDYTLSYKNNVRVGKATVIITGIGNYMGTVTLSFNIVRSQTEEASFSPTQFDDVKKEVEQTGRVWYVDEGYLEYVVAYGLMNGYSDTNNFGPYDPITRGQVVTVLCRSYMGNAADSANNKVSTGFSDVVSDQYYTAAVKWAKDNLIVTGDAGKNTFRPNDEVTREELAVMMYRYAEFAGADLTASEIKFNSLIGSENTSSWAKEAVVWCAHNDIITGVALSDGNYLQPKETAWRSAMAKIITVALCDVFE